MPEQTQNEQVDNIGCNNIFQTIADKLDTAQLYHKAGDLQNAEDIYKQILREDPYFADAYHLLGLIALQVGDCVIAKEFIKTAISLQNDNYKFYANLGATYFNLQKWDEAVATYQKAIDIKPDYAEAYLNQGIILKEQEKFEEAVRSLDKAVTLKQDQAKGFALLAEVLIKLDRHDEANEIAQAAFKLGSTDPTALRSMVQALASLGRPGEAVSVARSLVEKAPTDPESHIRLAGACLEAGLWSEGIQCARRAIRLNPEDARINRVLSQALTVGAEWDEALQAADVGLGLDPKNEDLIAQKANILERKGRLREAYDLVYPLVKGKSNFKLNALSTFTTIAQRYGAASEAAALMNKARTNKGLPKNVLCSINFQAGSLLHNSERYDEAFNAYIVANNLKPRIYDHNAEEHYFCKIKEQFDSKFFHIAPRACRTYRRPIFIVGMPRSGTSLIEQILASHPSVYGGGELYSIGAIAKNLPKSLYAEKQYPHDVSAITEEDINWAAGKYTKKLDELDPERRFRVTDKMPQNFLHLGVMALMFPDATFIHSRRDPMDTCLSCYFQNFVAQGLTFAYKLENLGHYYLLYQDLMEHWKKILPVSIFEVQYERLVDKPGYEIKRLLDFCGLEWNDACRDFHRTKRDTRTASYDQVRRPIYTTSKKKWKKYEKHLETLKQALGYVEN